MKERSTHSRSLRGGWLINDLQDGRLTTTWAESHTHPRSRAPGIGFRPVLNPRRPREETS